MSQSSMINNSIFTKIDKEVAKVLSCHCYLYILGKKWFAFSLIEEDVFELKRKIGEVMDAK